MHIKPFKLERYFSKHEFTAPHLLCSSDCEPLTLAELLAMADDESLSLWKSLRLGYTEPQGHPALREAATKFYSSIAANDVLVAAPEEGIFVVMNSMLERGDHVITTFPAYQSLYEIAASIGCEVGKWIPERCDGGWSFDIDALKATIKKNTKLIVVNLPHNPTGATLSRPDFEELMKIADGNGIRVFSDEMYRFLEYDDGDRLPSVCDIHDGAISLFGLSKTFSLAGLRIGWLTTKDKKLIESFCAFKDYTTICSSAPSEALALMAMRSSEAIRERNLSRIRSNLALLDGFFQNHSDLFEWIRPKAGPIAFPKLRRGDVSEFCDGLIRAKGVMLLPGDVYDYEGNHFRVGFGREGTAEALAKLEEYVTENL
jgi:aspartate/methionine/tyrosine aminotransferase